MWCPDRPGLTAEISGFLSETGCNITDLNQHSDPDHDLFHLRTEFGVGDVPLDVIRTKWADNALAKKSKWTINDHHQKAKVFLFCSRSLHCVHDLIARSAAGELNLDIVGVASNANTAASACSAVGIPFHHVAVIPNNEAAHFQKMHDLFLESGAGCLVLARYMRILPAWFVDSLPEQIINVHHSFLPAFPGADPYRQAMERGVKMIGATAHYVTSILDDGPIIAQRTDTLSYRDSLETIRLKGRDLERVALAEAVRSHVEHRVITIGPRTIVYP